MLDQGILVSIDPGTASARFQFVIYLLCGVFSYGIIKVLSMITKNPSDTWIDENYGTLEVGKMLPFVSKGCIRHISIISSMLYRWKDQPRDIKLDYEDIRINIQFQ